MARQTLARTVQIWQTFGVTVLLLLAAYIPFSALILEGAVPRIAPGSFSWLQLTAIPLLTMPIALVLTSTILYLNKNQTVILTFVVLCNFFIPAASPLASVTTICLSFQIYLFSKAFHDEPRRIRELYLLGIGPERQFLRSALPRALRQLLWIYFTSLFLALYPAMQWHHDGAHLSLGKILFALLLPLAFWYMNTVPQAYLRDPYHPSAPATITLGLLAGATMVNSLAPLWQETWHWQQLLSPTLVTSMALCLLAFLGGWLVDGDTLPRKTLIILAAMIAGVGDFGLYPFTDGLLSTAEVRTVCIALISAVTLACPVKDATKRSLVAGLAYLAVILSLHPEGKYFAIVLLILLTWLKPQLTATGI
ncbi:hypothetical protein [Desulfurispira natronophila]|uniref:Uncharacterized protein n=1 Tax=Desulfurispira natronophila TaxID=682562 RepID=A0A7W7Y4F0_9BACT|nr:hypothetical protein [Desulfurispira natronophila]MBB5021848.1 hypothetical protein [Desulfurispira natronophila]